MNDIDLELSFKHFNSIGYYINKSLEYFGPKKYSIL